MLCYIATLPSALKQKQKQDRVGVFPFLTKSLFLFIRCLIVSSLEKPWRDKESSLAGKNSINLSKKNNYLDNKVSCKDRDFFRS